MDVIQDFLNLHVNVKIRIIVNILRRASTDILIPFMTIYLAQKLGKINAGITISAILLSGIPCGLLGGWIQDQLGSKKIILIFETLHCLSMIGMILGYYIWDNTYLIALFYLLKGISFSLSAPAAEALLIDSSTKENRGFVFTFFYWSGSLAVVLGSVVGSFLFEEYFGLILILSALLSVIILSIYFVKIEDIKNKAKKVKRSGISDLLYGYMDVLKDRSFMLFGFSVVVAMSFSFQLGNLFSVKMGDIKVLDFAFLSLSGVEYFGLLRGMNVIIVTFFGFFSIKKLMEMENYTRFHMGLVFMVLGSAGTYFFNGPYWIATSIAMVAVGGFLYAPASNAIFTEILQDQNKGKYIAIFHLRGRMGNILSSFFLPMGAIMTYQEIAILLLFLGVVAIALNVFIEKQQEELQKR